MHALCKAITYTTAMVHLVRALPPNENKFSLIRQIFGELQNNLTLLSQHALWI